MSESSLSRKITALPWLKTKRRKIITLVIILILVFLGWRALAGNNKPVQYQTARAEKGTLVSAITASGIVASSNSVPITTLATGAINQIFVKNGDVVGKGDAITTIILDQTSLQKQGVAWASYLSAQNSLNAAKAKINSLQASLFTANKKFVNGAGTQNPITDDPTYIIQKAEWLQAEADYINQKGVIAQAETALSNAWLSYSQASATVTAPIAGVVSEMSFAKGAVLPEASFGAIVSPKKIAAIKTNTDPTVDVNLSEIDAPKVKLGDKATLTFDAIPNKKFAGGITVIDTLGIVSSGVTSYPAIITLEEKELKIFMNMSASADIITDRKSNVLLVPLSSVQMQGDRSYVRILKNKAIVRTQVKTGISSDTEIEIISGLTENSEVITGIVSGNNVQGQQNVSPFGVRFGGIGGGSRNAR